MISDQNSAREPLFPSERAGWNALRDLVDCGTKLWLNDPVSGSNIGLNGFLEEEALDWLSLLGLLQSSQVDTLAAKAQVAVCPGRE